MPKRPARYNGLPKAIRLLGASIAMAHASAGFAADSLDWVPKAQLTPEQQKLMGPSCSGLYVDPLADEPVPKDLDKEPISVDANGAHVSEGQTMRLNGDVVITQGSRKLKAGQMLYDKQEDEAALTGGVEIRQPGVVIRGKDARVSMSKNQASFAGGDFVLHATHLRGSAQTIEQTASGKVILHEGKLTSCEPGSQTWLLEGEELQIDPQSSQGRGRDITVRIRGIPVFYTPYIFFPVGSERQSGLLFPTVGLSNGKLDYAQPWYWNIAPYLDATLIPRYSGGHGAMLETEVRYLHRRANNELRLAYLPNDAAELTDSEKALLDQGAQEQDIHPFKDNERWLVNWQQQGGFDLPWYSQVDYSQASDVDYLRDLSTANFSASNDTYLNQSFVLGYNFAHWRLNVRAQSYQNLLRDLDSTYRQLPRVNLDGLYQFGDFGLSLQNEYVNFSHPSRQRLDGSTIITGSRSRADYQLNWQYEPEAGFIKPAVGAQLLAYQLDETNLLPDVDAAPNLATQYASLDSGLIFERNSGRQLLEPRLYYLYRTHADHSALYNLTADGQAVNFDTTPLTFSYEQLFRDHRYAGGDRLDDANHLAISLTGRLLDSSYSEYLSASVGQLVYFDRRQVFLGDTPANSLAQTRSDFAGQIKAVVSETLNAQTDLLYNPSNQQLMRFTTGLNLHQGGNLYNLGYRFVRQNEEAESQVEQTIDQLDLSALHVLNPQWTLMARAFYDIDGGRPMDSFIGTQYEDCCYALRVLARRWVNSKLAGLAQADERQYDQGVFFEVELKGLGSSGQRIQSLLKNSIIGFNP
ncbi:MAG TPA: LPS-assembly protein LptD [Cellvibrionaceae bacterium]